MADNNGPAAEVIDTGIPRLDRILAGGFVRGTLAMIIGAPGVGKTVMALQMAFHRAAQGGAALFLTGYSETHEKLLSHTHGLTFFRPELIGDTIQFANLLDLLREGPEGTEAAIVDMARSQHASLVVIDGFRGMRRLLSDDEAVAHFLYSLGAKLALLGATTVVIVEGDPDEPSRYQEVTVCDVILALRRAHRAGRQRRLLEVVKARGVSPLEGLHPFTMTDAGLSVYPRFESTVMATGPEWAPGRSAFGVERLDAMLGGGLNVGTATLAAGSPGMGKTLLGLHFAAEGARVREPVLFLGFMESAAQLREQARTFGLDMTAAEAAGHIRLRVLPAHDLEADYVASALAEEVERGDIRRLVIDSAADLERAIGDRDRKSGFLSALVSYLRSHQVTSYFTLDIPTIVGPALEFTDTPLSVIAENLLVMRNVEYRGELHRVFSVLKMRFSDHERAIYEHTISTGQGIHILGPAPLGEGLLTGIARSLVDIPLQREPGAG